MYRTEQEQFWSGEFGDAYTSRNTGEHLQGPVMARMVRVLSRLARVRSVLELGANVGDNLRALRVLLPDASLAAVEINAGAFERLRMLPGVTAHLGSVLDYKHADPVDLVFTAGLLIHLNPDDLPRVYETLYNSTSRYIALCEYYNPVPVEVPYRGYAGRLYKRDFAGDLLTRYGDLRLVDYGFLYHRDPVFPADDFTWFVLEKDAH